MKIYSTILFFAIIFLSFDVNAQQDFGNKTESHVVYFGDTISFNAPNYITTPTDVDVKKIHAFYNEISKLDYSSVIESILQYKDENKLDDWLFYQLIRRVAQVISPKSANYNNYTLYKWYLLVQCG